MPRKTGDWDPVRGQIGNDILLDTAITKHAQARASERGLPFDKVATAKSAVRASGGSSRTVVTVLPTVQKPQTLPGTVFKADGTLPRAIIEGDVAPSKSTAAAVTTSAAAPAPAAAPVTTPLCWNQGAVIGRGAQHVRRWQRDWLVKVICHDDRYGGEALLVDENVPPRPERVQSVLREVQSLVSGGKPARPKLPAAVLNVGACSPGHVIGAQARNLKSWESEHSIRVVVAREEHSEAFKKYHSGRVLLYDLQGGYRAGEGTVPDNVLTVVAAVDKIIQMAQRFHDKAEKKAAQLASSAATAGPVKRGNKGSRSADLKAGAPSRLSAQHLPESMLPPEPDSDEET